MDLNNRVDGFVPGRIRHYPSELDRVPSRALANKGGVGKSATYSEIAAARADARVQAEPTGTPAGKNTKPFGLWEKGPAFGFGDFVDIINPLQHIPIVATVYRNFSGDSIGAAPRVIGGALWGRIGGLVGGLANAVLEWWSGKDIGDHIYAALFGDPGKEPNAAALAQNRFPLPASISRAAIPAKPKSADAAMVSFIEKPPPRPNHAGAHALRPEMFPLPHAARISYERSRKWDEPD
jgi:hypothetical protein